MSNLPYSVNIYILYFHENLNLYKYSQFNYHSISYTNSAIFLMNIMRKVTFLLHTITISLLL